MTSTLRRVVFDERSKRFKWVGYKYFHQEDLEFLLKDVKGLCQAPKYRTELDLSSVQLNYYDNCLFNYIGQRQAGVKHSKTCWVRYCERNISLGMLEPNLDNIKRLYPKASASPLLKVFANYYLKFASKRDAEGWYSLKHLPPLDFTIIGLFRRFVYSIKTVFGIRSRDRVIDVVESMKLYGIDVEKFTTPHPSILLYHLEDNSYTILTGRHRIAAAKYLQVNEARNSIQKVPVVIIEVPFGRIRTSRPYPGDVICKDCRC